MADDPKPPVVTTITGTYANEMGEWIEVGRRVRAAAKGLAAQGVYLGVQDIRDTAGSQRGHALIGNAAAVASALERIPLGHEYVAEEHQLPELWNRVEEVSSALRAAQSENRAYRQAAAREESDVAWARAQGELLDTAYELLALVGSTLATPLGVSVEGLEPSTRDVEGLTMYADRIEKALLSEVKTYGDKRRKSVVSALATRFDLEVSDDDDFDPMYGALVDGLEAVLERSILRGAAAVRQANTDVALQTRALANQRGVIRSLLKRTPSPSLEAISAGYGADLEVVGRQYLAVFSQPDSDGDAITKERMMDRGEYAASRFVRDLLTINIALEELGSTDLRVDTELLLGNLCATNGHPQELVMALNGVAQMPVGEVSLTHPRVIAQRLRRTAAELIAAYDAVELIEDDAMEELGIQDRLLLPVYPVGDESQPRMRISFPANSMENETHPGVGLLQEHVLLALQIAGISATQDLDRGHIDVGGGVNLRDVDEPEHWVERVVEACSEAIQDSYVGRVFGGNEEQITLDLIDTPQSP